MMPEPVAIAAGVASLLTSTYTLSKALYQAVDVILQAPTHLKLVSQDLKAFYSILSTLHGYLQEEDTAAGVVHPATCRDLRETLTQCLQIFQQLGELIAEFLRNDATEEVSKWKTVRYLWKQDEVSRIREHLMAHKVTINLAVCSANLINTRASLTTSQGIAAELQELRSRLTELLSEFKKAEDRYDERGVELSNLQASFSHFADHQQYHQPATSVRTPKTTSMVLTKSTSTVTPYTYYSLTSSILGPEGTRSDRESTYHDFMSLLSSSTIGTTNTASTYRTARAKIEAGSSESSVHTTMQHASAARRTRGPASRQIFVKGLQLNKSIVVNLENMTSFESLPSYLEDVTGVPRRYIRLSHCGRELTQIEDLPSNATVMATITWISPEFTLGYMAGRLKTRYSEFTAQSCVQVLGMLERDEYFHNFADIFSQRGDVLSDIADHYWRDTCKICQPLCWKAVDDEVMGLREEYDERFTKRDDIHSSFRSLLRPASLKQSIQTRVRNTSIKSIFRYQGLDMYKD